jgi:hypothetical protein
MGKMLTTREPGKTFKKLKTQRPLKQGEKITLL